MSVSDANDAETAFDPFMCFMEPTLYCVVFSCILQASKVGRHCTPCHSINGWKRNKLEGDEEMWQPKSARLFLMRSIRDVISVVTFFCYQCKSEYTAQSHRPLRRSLAVLLHKPKIGTQYLTHFSAQNLINSDTVRKPNFQSHRPSLISIDPSSLRQTDSKSYTLDWIRP